MKNVAELIRNVPDFPIPGIMFKDITPVLNDPIAFDAIIDEFADRNKDKGIEGIVGIESRGFILGAPLALKMGIPFILIRKEGKLPYHKEKASYDLEYGQATIEIHKDSIKSGQKIMIVDDLLATGGTAAASIDLVERIGGVVVNCSFAIELSALGGRAKLPDGKTDSLIKY